MSQSMAGALDWVPKSNELATTLSRSIELAQNYGHREVLLEHLLLALVDDQDASAVVGASGLDRAGLGVDLEDYLNAIPAEDVEAPAFSQAFVKILEYAVAAAQQSKRRDVNGAIVLAAIVGDGKSDGAGILRRHGLTFEQAIKALQSGVGSQTASPSASGEGAHEDGAPAWHPNRSGVDANVAREEILANARKRVGERTIQAKKVMRQGNGDTVGTGASSVSTEAKPVAPRRTGPVPDQVDRPAPEPRIEDEHAKDRNSRDQQQAREPEAETHPSPHQEKQEIAAQDMSVTRADDGTQDAREAPPGTWAPGSSGPKPGQTRQAAPPPLPPPIPPMQGKGTALNSASGPQTTTHPVLPPGPSRESLGPPRRGAPWPGGKPPDEFNSGGRLTAGASADPLSPGKTGSDLSDAPESPRRARAAASPGQKAAFDTGQLVENIPRRMRDGVREVVEVRIARSEIANLGADMLGRGAPQKHDLIVTKAMSVRLRAPEGGFYIESASPETQWVENALGIYHDDFASWRFAVTPQRAGRGRLQLVVGARTIGTEGLMAETGLPDQIIDVRVSTNYSRLALRSLSWIVAAVIGGLLARFGDELWVRGWPFIESLLG